MFNGARLGSLMAHLSVGGDPPASAHELVSRVCSDRNCECHAEFNLEALLANHREARQRLERLMRCPNFTVVDHATALVLAGNRQENLMKFTEWNARHQKAVSHFCRVEGVLRAIAKHVGASHLLAPLAGSSPRGFRGPRNAHRRVGPPSQQSPHGTHFPALNRNRGTHNPQRSAHYQHFQL